MYRCIAMLTALSSLSGCKRHRDTNKVSFPLQDSSSRFSSAKGQQCTVRKRLAGCTWFPTPPALLLPPPGLKPDEQMSLANNNRPVP